VVKNVPIIIDELNDNSIDDIMACHNNLLDACKWGCVPCTTRFILDGSDVNMEDYFARTPLLCAIEYGHLECMRVVLNHSTQVDVNRKDGLGSTPLHFAAQCNNEACLSLLLMHGAHINEQHKFGSTPLHSASYSGNLANMIALLNAGADPSIKNSDGGHTGTTCQDKRDP
jgi:ankyrin repeat protein